MENSGKESLFAELLSTLSTSSASVFASELLDSLETTFGVDRIIMLVLFWFLVTLIVAVGINIYRKVSHHQRKAIDEEKSTIDVNGNDSGLEAANAKECHTEPRTYTVGNGDDSQVWLQEFAKWIFATRSLTLVDDFFDAWLEALNVKSKKLISENGFYVRFNRFYEDQCTIPKLSEQRVTDEIDESIISTVKAYTDKLAFEVSVSSSPSLMPAQTATYEIFLEKFSSLLKAVCITREQLFVLRFLERPQTKVHINGPLLSSQKEQFSPDAIINAILNVFTCTVVDLHFAKYSDHPQINSKYVASSEPDFLQGSSVERKLLMKVVNVDNVGLQTTESQSGHGIYCVIEIDEPNQVAKTSPIRKEANSPVWDQHFMFNLNSRSNEILFELHDDRGGHKEPTSTQAIDCLGQAIVSIAELKLNPSQVQTIPIQFKQPKTKGDLTVEFLLMEHRKATGSNGEQEPTRVNETNLNSFEPINFVEPPSLVRRKSITSATGTIATFSDDFIDFFTDKPETASFQLNTQLDSDPESTSSLIKSVERDCSIFDQLPLLPRRYSASIDSFESIISDNYEGQSERVSKSPLFSSKPDDNGHSSEGYGTDRAFTPEDQNGTLSTRTPSPVVQRNESKGRDSGTLIRSIKKRFSFSKRSKSMERNVNREASPVRVNGGDDFDRDERARSVPGSREPSMPRETINGKKQESFGNLSQASGRTFLHEDSVLILETTENGVKKHFVVANPTAKRSKWKRKGGLKLHMVNDHLFVAKHISNNMSCQVCQKKFSRRLGKQAYQCRDCKFMCHKPCHVNVEDRCLQSSLSTLNLELVGDAGAEYGTGHHHIDRSATLPPIVPEVRVTSDDGELF